MGGTWHIWRYAAWRFSQEEWFMRALGRRKKFSALAPPPDCRGGDVEGGGARLGLRCRRERAGGVLGRVQIQRNTRGEGE